jgi:hypothetical protein
VPAAAGGRAGWQRLGWALHVRESQRPGELMQARGAAGPEAQVAAWPGACDRREED